MKKMLIILILILFFISAWCYTQNEETKSDTRQNLNEPKNSFSTVNPWKFKQLAINWNYEIIDIRSKQELHKTWIIPNSINIDFYWQNFIEKLNQLDKEKDYLIYCRTWNRTGETLKIMKDMWFKNAHHLWWWITNWIAQNYEVISCKGTDIC